MQLNHLEEKEWQQIIAEADKQGQMLANYYRLPLSSRAWQGTSGPWRGKGAGNSIDFHDHRPYMLGDDPRHIDWKAYGRSGSTIMKLYEEEVSPAIDIFFDFSTSMFINAQKAKLAFELFYFIWHSASANSQQVNIQLTAGKNFMPLSSDDILAHRFPKPFSDAEVAFKAARNQSSLKILISDLLFQNEPRHVLKYLVGANTRLLFFVPQSKEEKNPDWQGNLDLIDIETEHLHQHYIDAKALKTYRENYARHFDLWRDEISHCAGHLALFDDASSLRDQLANEGLKNQIVEAAL